MSIARPVVNSPRPVVYIAGPYTHPDPVLNTHQTVTVATDLLVRRFAWPVVPHLTLLWHAITPLPYQTWLDLDLALLARCDALLRLPGASSGADGEVAEALRLGLPTFTDINGLRIWCRKWSAA